MKNCPVVAHHQPSPTAADIAAVERLGTSLKQERPRLALEDDFRELVADSLQDAPTLHLDDLTGIPHMDMGLDVRFYQERARLRAGNNDLVATSSPIADRYESYCREQLGLGAVEWLHPQPAKNPLRIAEACWEDEEIRSLLIERIRGGLRYLHPHMGTFAVWELAALLREASGCPLKVIAPPPRLSAWVNDKVAFAEVVSRLFGSEFVPRTMCAYNFAILAQRVQELARSSPRIGIKLPNSAGGDGNIVLDSKSFGGHSLGAIREQLKQILPVLNWSGESELLVDSWETDVVCSPSAQLWLPPMKEGDPLVEGIFGQYIEGPTGIFAGSAAAALPSEIAQEITTRSWLLGRLFQHLGYVGRCSFDLILAGVSLEKSRIEFIECNGRWGGTSAPMTLMNRLFGDWANQPYVTRVCDVPGVDRLSFESVHGVVGQHLLDRNKGTGHIVLSIPGRMTVRSAIDILAIGSDVAEAHSRVASFVELISAAC